MFTKSRNRVLRRVYRVALLLLVSTASSVVVHAKDVLVLDQKGAPVANAVFSFDQVENSEVTQPPLVMDQVGKAFVPYVLVAQKGNTVTFPNSDDIRHHVYSFSNPKPFEIRLYHGTPSQPVTFDRAGIVQLGCNIHDHMRAYIFVADQGVSRPTNELGRTSLPASTPSLKVWHPDLSISQVDVKDVELGQADSDGVYRVQLNLLSQKVHQHDEGNRFKRRFGS